VTSASAEWEVAYRSVEHNLDDRIAKIREFDLDNSMRVLDLGCGDGIDLEAFRDLGFSSVFGIDISHSLLQALRDSGFSMLNCDVYDIALQDGAVDLVYGNNVLHHFRAILRLG
jgi:2-polyprenyl-3-methyl-5-hydroxy-6-metoxy-1,4-benzoquinol methylase